MLRGWVVREFMVCIFWPVAVFSGLVVFVSWLGPMGVTGETLQDVVIWGVGLAATGVGSRWVHRRRAAEGDGAVSMIVMSVPVWVWVTFAAAHGVFVGGILALPLEMDFTVMMLGGGVLAAPLGFVLRRSAAWPGKAEGWLTMLRALPGWMWVALGAGHGAFVGAVLALPLQFDLALAMAGGAGIGVALGLVLRGSVQWPEGGRRERDGNEDQVVEPRSSG